MNTSLIPPKQNWKEIVAKYQTPQRIRSLWQIINTLVPYAFLWYLMVKALSISVWLMLPLSVIAAGFLVRIFIIFHDCGHGSFLKSQKANNFWGYITGVLTFTPYQFWRHEHAIHHSQAGNLDRRGIGEVWTMTVKEYLAASRKTRIRYRLARNPVCLFMIGAPILFLIVHRLPSKKFDAKWRKSVYLTNFGLLLMAAAMSLLIGVKAFLLIQLPIVMLAASAGVWLFMSSINSKESTGNDGRIGIMSARPCIHHLSPRIPNYFLERCHQENPLFQQIRPITLFASLKSLAFRLWDEQHKRLVGFRYLKNLKFS